jgi:hypothetical protein
VESKDPTTTDAPKPHPPSSGDAKGIDYADVSKDASHQPVKQGGPPPRDDANGKEPPLSPLLKLFNREGATDFNHPAAVEEQRVIWLAKDPFGLVKEIERDLDSHDILHTTECAKMSAKGQVDVDLIPEDA